MFTSSFSSSLYHPLFKPVVLCAGRSQARINGNCQHPGVKFWMMSPVSQSKVDTIKVYRRVVRPDMLSAVESNAARTGVAEMWMLRWMCSVTRKVNLSAEDVRDKWSVTDISVEDTRCKTKIVQVWDEKEWRIRRKKDDGNVRAGEEEARLAIEEVEIIGGRRFECEIPDRGCCLGWRLVWYQLSEWKIPQETRQKQWPQFNEKHCEKEGCLRLSSSFLQHGTIRQSIYCSQLPYILFMLLIHTLKLKICFILQL